MRAYKTLNIKRLQLFVSIDTHSNHWNALLFNESQPKERGITFHAGPIGFVCGLVSKEYKRYKSIDKSS